MQTGNGTRQAMQGYDAARFGQLFGAATFDKSKTMQLFLAQTAGDGAWTECRLLRPDIQNEAKPAKAQPSPVDH
jgi:hypothetical protein